MAFLPDPLHPAVVHFPIALVLVALLFELVARHPRGQRLAPAVSVLVVLAACGAVAAVVTGSWARDEAVVPPGAVAQLHDHEERGETAMWVLLAVAAARVWLGRRGRLAGLWAWASVVALVVAALLVVRAARLGGGLVFDHGVGTAAVARESAAPRAAPPSPVSP